MMAKPLSVVGPYMATNAWRNQTRARFGRCSTTKRRLQLTDDNSCTQSHNKRKTSYNSLAQYDNQSEDLGLNHRLRYN